MNSGAERVSQATEEAASQVITGSRRRHVHISASGGGLQLGAGELWEYRGLLYFLVWRDIKARYAQTVLGAAWAVLQPVLSMVVFTIIFGRFVRVPSEGVPYPVFSLSGIVAWTYFTGACSGASNSLINNTGLITKVYFPRLVIPTSPLLAGLVDFGIAFAVLLTVMLWFGWLPSPARLFLLPLPMLLTMMTALGAGCWLSALNVQYRDVKYVTGFLLQIWMYASPIIYPLAIVPAGYRLLYSVNPMTTGIAGFRAALLNTRGPTILECVISLASATALFLSGLLYFRRTERIFADVI